MAARIRLTTMESGRYQATIGGVRYELVKRRQEIAPKIIWELFRLPDEERTPISTGPTMEALRHELEQLLPPPSQSDRLAIEADYLRELLVSVEIARDQARHIDLLDTGVEPKLRLPLAVSQRLSVALRSLDVAVALVASQHDRVSDAALAAEEAELAADDPQLELVDG